jgi:proteasome accessory factor C
MADVSKTERIIRIIRLLLGRKKTVKQLAEILSTQIRSIYRDLDDIKNLGYLLDCDENARYSLVGEKNGYRNYFTIEETRLIREHLSTLSATHPLKSSIWRKLYLSSELIPIADQLADKHRGTIVSRINEAITTGKQVRLIRYHSNNSSTVADRVVDPTHLTDDFSVLSAFEISSGKQKTFRVARIEDLEILSTDSVYKQAPEELDLFGFSGPESINVIIHLSAMAHRYLFEEFESSRPYMTQKDTAGDFPYEFRSTIRDYRGIGRFLLGLPGEVKVIESEGLRLYLRERAGRGGW